MNLIQLIKDNGYTPTGKDVHELEQYLEQLQVEKKVKDAEKKYTATIKGWEDYGDDYHFHSPPDCLYHPDGRAVHASVMEYYGNKEYDIYSDSKILFFIDGSDVIEIEDWNLKDIK